MGYEEATDTIKIAFRGTKPTSLFNWISNLKVHKKSVDYCKDC